MDPGTIAAVASHELKTSIRSRWTTIFAGAFAGLALAISYFGLATQRVAGFQGFERTVASLLNLVFYLAPLAGLMMGALALSGNKGAAELLFSQPVSRTDVLVGKALGLFASMAIAITAGFGLAGVIIAGQSGYEGVQVYVAMTLLSLVLALMSIGLGLMAAVIAGSRAKAVGAALGLWFFFVLFYDLLVLGAAALLKERTANFVLFASVFGNPVEIVRVSALFAIGGENVFGAAGPMLLKFLGGRTAAGFALGAAALVWTVLPLSIAARLFRKREI